jgi:integrase
MQAKSERLKKWTKVAAAFDETRLLVGITCGKPTAEVFENYGNFVHKIAGEITKKNPEAYEKSRPDLIRKVFAARAAIRKELGIDTLNPPSLTISAQAAENNTKGVRPFVLYSLRHTFLTRLGESGCDAWTLARIAGHSSITISARYVHPSEDAVLVAMSRLGGHKIGHRNVG